MLFVLINNGSSRKSYESKCQLDRCLRTDRAFQHAILDHCFLNMVSRRPLLAIVVQ